MTNQITVENPEQFNSSAEFLAAVIENNKSKVKNARWFTIQLKWPASLITDILNGRRTLSLRRGLEFAERFSLGSVVTEKLIYLILAESPEAAVAKHYRELRQKEHFGISTIPIATDSVSQREVLEEIRESILVRLSKLAPHADIDALRAHCFNTDNINPNAEKGGEKKKLVYKLFPEEVWKTQVKYLTENIQKYLENDSSQLRYSLAISNLPKSRLNEIDNKINETFRWIATLADVDQESEQDLFQILFCMHPLADTKRLLVE